MCNCNVYVVGIILYLLLLLLCVMCGNVRCVLLLLRNKFPGKIDIIMFVMNVVIDSFLDTNNLVQSGLSYMGREVANLQSSLNHHQFNTY